MIRKLLYIRNLLLFAAISILFAGCARQTVGVTEGRLSKCPSLPNCVTSMADPDVSGTGPIVEPLEYTGSTARARQVLVSVLENMEGSRIIEIKNDYVHAEFRSALFGFVDDVEFLFRGSVNIIHIRSASRSGFYDFNVNKRRVEKIRSLFKKKMAEITIDEISERDMEEN